MDQGLYISQHSRQPQIYSTVFSEQRAAATNSVTSYNKTVMYVNFLWQSGNDSKMLIHQLCFFYC